MSEDYTNGLLGMGAFGRLAATHLARHRPVLAHDPRCAPDAIRTTGARPASFEDACRAPFVVLAVPVQALPGVLAAAAPCLGEGAVVADVASVKALPVAWMLERLPPHIQVVGTHPLFGPQTAAEQHGIAGEPIALCRARIDDASYARIRSFLADTLGLSVVELTPDDHDRQMARVQVLTHLIGHAARELALPELPTGTLAYRRLLQMMHNTERDSDELFAAIQRLNPHAAAVRAEFLEALARVARRAEGAEGV